METIRQSKNQAKKQSKKILAKNSRELSREDLRRGSTKNHHLDNSDSDFERNNQHRGDESDRRRRTGSRLSFADEHDLSDENRGGGGGGGKGGQNHRKASSSVNRRQRQDSNRSNESLRNMIKTASMSNLDMRRDSPEQQRRDKKVSSRETSRERRDERNSPPSNLK